MQKQLSELRKSLKKQLTDNGCNHIFYVQTGKAYDIQEWILDNENKHEYDMLMKTEEPYQLAIVGTKSKDSAIEFLCNFAEYVT